MNNRRVKAFTYVIGALVAACGDNDASDSWSSPEQWATASTESESICAVTAPMSIVAHSITPSLCTLDDAPGSEFDGAATLTLLVDRSQLADLAISLITPWQTTIAVAPKDINVVGQGEYKATLAGLSGGLVVGDWTLQIENRTETPVQLAGWHLVGAHATAGSKMRRTLHTHFPEYLAYFSNQTPLVWYTAERRKQFEDYLTTSVMPGDSQAAATSFRNHLRAAVAYSPTFRALMFATLSRRAPMVMQGSPEGTAGLSTPNGDLFVAISHPHVAIHEYTHSWHRIVTQRTEPDPLTLSARDFVYAWMAEEDYAEALTALSFTEWKAQRTRDASIPDPGMQEPTFEQVSTGTALGAPAEFFFYENPGHFGLWLYKRFPSDVRLTDHKFWALSFDEAAIIARDHNVPEADIAGVRALIYDYVRPPRNLPIE